MILWGWGERVLTFDLAEHEYCQRCEQKQDFTLRLKYKYGHFYHLFGWVISKQYQLICPVCSHGWVVNASAAEAQTGATQCRSIKDQDGSSCLCLQQSFGLQP